MKKFILFIFLIPNIIWAQTRRYELTESVRDRVIPGMVAVKLKATPTNARSSTFRLDALKGVESIEPLHKNPTNAQRDAPSILDGIFLVKISQHISPVSFCNELLKNPEIEYAEAILREELFHTPNDPAAQIGTGNQGYLDVIKAYSAWDITKGSADIVIGVIDTGADLQHEDLNGKLFQNFGEAPIANGIDEDGNGYIDDIRGYDFADDDNNAQADGNQHGTHVSGIAGANTNNGLGIASVGYQTKIAALKGFTTAGSISTGVWEAVIYAADNGYDIANLSWGSSGYSSQVFQDIIDYCVLEKDMVVIAAAGNTNADLDFYPAGYENVLSVAGTTLTDTKWSGSTYSDFVDITAPALSIYSTQNNNTYNSDNGTSHSAPQVAGVAALVKSVFPEYNAIQIMEHVRVTSDNIYGISGNETYAYKLGKGRLNAYRAVTEGNSRSLRVHDFNYNNGFGPYAFFGDTVTVDFDLTNYLASLNSPSVSITSTSPYATILDGNLQPGAFQTLQTKELNGIKIVVNEDTPPETKIGLRFTMAEGGYSDFQNVSIVTQPNWHNFDNGDLSGIIVGDGSLGYLDDSFSEGYDFDYKSQSVLRYAGLLFGTAANDIQDNVINDFVSEIRDDDFQGEKNLKLFKNEVISGIGYSEFSSTNGDYWIEQSIVPSENNSLMILSYRIINTSGATINDFNAGFFSDVILGNPLENHAEWDANLNAIVFKDNSESIFSALQLLGESYHYAALDLQDANGNVRDILDTFSDVDKYAQLSGVDKNLAGAIGVGNDVAGLASISRSSLANGDEVRLSVVLTFADDYTGLEANLAEASMLYGSFLQHPQVLETFFSCEGNDVIVDPTTGSQFQFFEDALGNTGLGTSDQLIVTNISQDTAIFVRNVDGIFPSDFRKINIQIIDQVADFSPSIDTLYLDHPTVNTISFSDLSFRPIDWSWDFDNGTGASVQNPIVNFDTPGVYDISLTVNSSIGCSDFVTKKIVVANRPVAPVLSSISLCKGDITSLIHPTEEYVVYNSDGEKLDKGASVDIGPYGSSTTINISQITDGFESLPTNVQVTVDPLSATYSLTPDLSASATSAIFTYTGGTATNIEWKINNQIVSTETTFNFQIDGSPLDLELSVTNETCSDALIETIFFSPSSVPTVGNYSVCLADDVTIKPTSGSSFGFYSDASLTNLLLKGSELTLQQVQANQTIYIVGLDNILPSSPVSISVSVIDFESNINVTPELLDLSTSQTAHFTSANEATTSAKWYINDELVDQSLTPILLFDTPGSYLVRLEAMNAEGCLSISNREYIVVSEITGIPQTESLNIYPNPVKRGEQIAISETAESVKLFGIDGRFIGDLTIINGGAKIPMSMKPGVYLLLIGRMEHTLAIKLVLE